MDNNNMYDQNNQTQNQQPGYEQQAQQPYQQPYQPVYQAPAGAWEEPVSYGEWIVTLLIMMIPCVNIVMMFVWAFGSGSKQSKANLCKAQLTWVAIVIVLYILAIVAFGGSLLAALNEASSYSYY